MLEDNIQKVSRVLCLVSRKERIHFIRTFDRSKRKGKTMKRRERKKKQKTVDIQ